MPRRRTRASSPTPSRRVIPTFPKVWPTILLATLSTFVISAGVAVAASLVSDDAPAGGSTAPVAAPLPQATTSPPKAGSRAAEPTPHLPATVGSALPKPNGAAVAPTDLRRSGRVLADRLTRSGPRRRARGLIAGDGSARALTIALETARRLSTRESTLLVDLGAAQDWFADILDREDAALGGNPGPCRSAGGEGGLRRGDPPRSLLRPRRRFHRGGGRRRQLEDVFPRSCRPMPASSFTPPTGARRRRDPPRRLRGNRRRRAGAKTRRAVEQARAALGDARILPFAVMRPQSTLEEVGLTISEPGAAGASPPTSAASARSGAFAPAEVEGERHDPAGRAGR